MGGGIYILISIQKCAPIKIECEIGENTLRVPIPHNIKLEGLIEINLEINKLYSPTEINKNSLDERKLGIGVFSVQLL